jgi:hypothetical protein
MERKKRDGRRNCAQEKTKLAGVGVCGMTPTVYKRSRRSSIIKSTSDKGQASDSRSDSESESARPDTQR